MPCGSRNVHVGSALPVRLGAGSGASGRHLGSVSEAPPIDKSRTAVLYPNSVATPGILNARLERELSMNSSLTPKGLDSRTWNGVDILRRPSDGYVNATAMCKAYGKLFADYWRLERTTQYAQALMIKTSLMCFEDEIESS